ncbi:MAG: adenylate/guanylate cyclase domain-containing protein, partial [Candidatus Cloacimonadota bacterium]|nr:adenylate/guanylate cyclase domain-containing protein [Candidatus Cloacimonadota bacterium]
MKNFVPSFIIERLNNSPKSSGSLKAFTMFIDISGFTSMTQTLMKKGKEGSEILTTIINDIFTPSIKSIYDHHGFITTFAGDAFTAVFPKSKSTAKHLLSSAFEINQIFAKIGNQTSRLGNFQLEVKIGISFGDVKWKIVSNENQNAYYFRGDAINNCAFSEHRCEKGDIVFDKELLAFIKNDSFDYQQIANEINHYLIKPSKIIGIKKYDISSKKNNTTKTMGKFVPKEIMQTKVKGEFRDIVSCFISFQESNRIDDLITHMLNLAAKYGGYLNKVDFGDKGGVALVLFGAPTVKEKLLERANNFILEVQELDNYSIRAGITFGKVFAGFVGSEIRSEYTALGEIVNLSARFMMKAKWGQSYLDRRIYTNVKDSYNIKELAPEKFKGISGKIPTFLLLSKKQSSLEKQFTGKIFGR